MKILIAPDKFKDSLTAMEAADAIKEGILSAIPMAECTSLPLADGGDGTAHLLTHLCNGKLHSKVVQNPLFENVQVSWGYQSEKRLAFLEIAEASGLELLALHQRNPLHTSTYGTGELIKEAIDKGAREIILGLGGSATNDGGTGIAAALGYRFLDSKGRLIAQPRGSDLIRIRSIDTRSVHTSLNDGRLKITAACDVKNQLLGTEGATYTYAIQKGAEMDDLPALEEGMANLAQLILTDLGLDVSKMKGSGAAGGSGAGVIAFLKGRLCSGTDLVLGYSGFHEKLKNADLLVSGEGRIDATSFQGKLVGRLSEFASQRSIPLAAFCGSNHLTEEATGKLLIRDIISISTHEKTLESSIKNSYQNLKNAAFNYFSDLIK